MAENKRKVVYIRVSAKQMRLFQVLISILITFFLIALMDGNIWKEFLITAAVCAVGTAIFLEVKYRSKDYRYELPDNAEIIQKNLWATKGVDHG